MVIHYNKEYWWSSNIITIINFFFSVYLLFVLVNADECWMCVFERGLVGDVKRAPRKRIFGV